MNMLPGDYIAGFVDGEGCFYLNYRSEKKRKRRGQPVYFRWTPYFAVVLRKDDFEILTQIKDVLGCGTISYSGDTVRYNVQDVDDVVHKVVPFFRKYPLRAKKRHDFDLWCKAVEIIYVRYKEGRRQRGKRISYTDAEHGKLIGLRKLMKNFKAKQWRDYINSPL